MSKQRLENAIARLQKSIDQIRPDNFGDIMHQALHQDKVPRNPKLKEVKRLLEDSYYLAKCGQAIPAMPHHLWSAEYGTVSQPVGWEPPAPVPGTKLPTKKKPHIVPKNDVVG